MGNLRYLYAIERALAVTLRDHEGVNLLVICNRPTGFRIVAAGACSVSPLVG